MKYEFDAGLLLAKVGEDCTALVAQSKFIEAMIAASPTPETGVMLAKLLVGARQIAEAHRTIGLLFLGLPIPADDRRSS